MLNNVKSALENPVTVPVILLALLVLGVFWTLSAVASDRRARKPMFSDNKPLNALGWFGMLLSPLGAVILVAVLWEMLALAWSYPKLDPKVNNAADIRWHGSIMLAMLAALGALFTLLFAYIRVFTTERQTKAAEAQASATAEALFNDKINVAANDLHARRQITIEIDGVGGADRFKETWQDDIIRRAAAIDRLEGLAGEHTDAAPRIARLLSVYIRELSRVITPENKEHPRADMEKAVQSLGRLKTIDGVKPDEVEIDLRQASLCGFDLSRLCFEKANLIGAQMQGANLLRAQMQGANPIGAKMQGANLRRAQMQGADLIGAKMQGANLDGAQMDGSTDLRAAVLRGAALLSVDYTSVPISQKQVDDLFYDGSVTFAEGIRRAPGREEKLDRIEFLDRWRAWQEEIGFDPENPDG